MSASGEPSSRTLKPMWNQKTLPVFVQNGRATSISAPVCMVALVTTSLTTS